MFSGIHRLEAVLELAAQQREQLEQYFNVPVLLFVDAEGEEELEPVTAAGQRPDEERPNGVTSHVVAITPRFAGTTRLAFGRSEVCDVVMPFAAISKHHGYLERVDGGWTIVDAGSTNGTVVNGKVARERPVLLTDHAVLTFGPLMARFLVGSSFIESLKQRLALRA